jgi:hypothetical protein
MGLIGLDRVADSDHHLFHLAADLGVAVGPFVQLELAGRFDRLLDIALAHGDGVELEKFDRCRRGSG